MSKQTQHRILVIEDDPLVARALARSLKAASFSVDVVNSCAAARELDAQYDIGIFDIELGDGFGTNLAHELVLGATVRSVVFYTGATYQPLLKRAAQLGPVVCKDDGPRALLATVRHRLNSPRRRFISGSLSDGDVVDLDGFTEPERTTGSS